MMISLRKSLRTILFLTLLVCLCAAPSFAQEVVDKTVAVVSDGARKPQLITYSDLLWQLALQRGVPLEKPRSEDLNQALQILINQRIFALEAERLPRAAPSTREVADKIADTLTYFPSPAVFESRLKQVGFASVKDPAFEALMAQRIAVEQYIDFRFASFVVVTADEESNYYRDVYVPESRRRTPGLLVESLDSKRIEINGILKSQKIAAAIERFLDETKRRVQIEILIEV